MTDTIAAAVMHGVLVHSLTPEEYGAVYGDGPDVGVQDVIARLRAMGPRATAAEATDPADHLERAARNHALYGRRLGRAVTAAQAAARAREAAEAGAHPHRAWSAAAEAWDAVAGVMEAKEMPCFDPPQGAAAAGVSSMLQTAAALGIVPADPENRGDKFAALMDQWDAEDAAAPDDVAPPHVPPLAMGEPIDLDAIHALDRRRDLLGVLPAQEGEHLLLALADEVPGLVAEVGRLAAERDELRARAERAEEALAATLAVANRATRCLRDFGDEAQGYERRPGCTRSPWSSDEPTPLEIERDHLRTGIGRAIAELHLAGVPGWQGDAGLLAGVRALVAERDRLAEVDRLRAEADVSGDRP